MLGNERIRRAKGRQNHLQSWQHRFRLSTRQDMWQVLQRARKPPNVNRREWSVREERCADPMESAERNGEGWRRACRLSSTCCSCSACPKGRHEERVFSDSMCSSSDVARQERRDWLRRHLRQTPSAFGAELSIGSERTSSLSFAGEYCEIRHLCGSELCKDAATLDGLQCSAHLPGVGDCHLQEFPTRLRP